MGIQLKLFPTTFSISTTSNTNRFSFSTTQTKAVSGKAQLLIQTGAVRPVLPKEAASAIKSQGYVLLDIRPDWERDKARVSGSLHVPLFVEDMDNGPLTLLKKWVHFGYIGLWTGQNFTMINPDFVQQVELKVPDKDSKLLVACGEGLRSMMAVAKLHDGGYRKLGWLAGGFTRSKDDDFLGVEGPEKLQYATIGGSFVTDEKSPASKLLSSTNEIARILFSTLETHDSMAIEGQRNSTGNNIVVEEHSKMLCERVNSTIKSLVLPESPKNEEEIASLKDKLRKDLRKITEKCQSLEKELNANTHMLELSKERYHSLEREFHLLNEDHDTLIQSVSSSSKSLAEVSEEKDRIWQDLNSEAHRRKQLEEEMKQFGITFARRQKSLVSLQSEFKSKFEKLKAQNSVSIPKSLGY